MVSSLVRRSRAVLAAAVALTALACTHDPVSPRAEAPLTALPRTLTTDERAVIAGTNGFAFGLLRDVAAHADPAHNVFVSPLSVSMALGMVMNGTDGETQAQLRRTLGFGDLPLAGANAAYRSLIELLLRIDRGVDFRVANSVWQSGYPIRPEFLARVRASFDAEARTVSFSDPATVGTINDWVKATTNGKIPTILNEIEADEILFLVNAIYFNGNWRNRFDAAATAPAPFTTASGIRALVTTMRQTHTFAYARRQGYQAVDLPYGRGAFTMTVLLPDSSSSVDALLARLTPAEWAALSEFRDTANVELALPKFELEDRYLLKENLRRLGIVDAFDASVADFTPLSPAPRGLEISRVIHKTFVDVHEAGTEAAAATVAGVRLVCFCPPQPARFIVDRPFVFVIRERFSGAILFMGRMSTLPV